MEIVVNPREENPSTLRALALMLNSIASDRDGGPVVGSRTTVTEQVGEISRTITQETLPKSSPDTGAVAGASTDLTPPPPPPSANALAGSSIYGELDKNGLPWDERIHSSSKNKNADETWRYLRGGDVELRATVEAELRAKMANAETPPAAPVVDNAGDVPPPPPPPAPATGADAPPPPPPPVVEPQADPAPTGVTAAAVFKRVTELKASGKIDQAGIDMALASVDVESLASFMKRAKEDGLPAAVLDALNAVAGGE